MPAPVTPADLLDRLLASGLVVPDAVQSLRAWAADARPGLGQLAQQVLDRNLLTRYQLREVAAGRADRLRLGPYHLLDLLGEGGMGQVFHARHTRLNREVAVKLIRPEKVAKGQTVERFRQEIRAAGRLHHPNVVLAFDADESDGRHYYAMEFVPGADLGKLVADRGPLPVAEAVGYIRQAADGLQHAADLGLVHRDVKPGNLLVGPDGRVKVLDLGLALLAADDPDAGAAGRPGTVLGTPDFLAPEQARDPLAVDPRADVYGLGGTLFFLLTGQPPFGGESPTDKVLRHFTSPVPSVRAVRPDVPPDLDALIGRMLAKDPADRPQSPGAAATALGRFVAGGSGLLAVPPPADAREWGFDPPAVTPRPAAKPGRRRGPVVAAALVLAVAVGGAAVLLGGRTGGTATDEPPAAFINPLGTRFVRLAGGSVTTGSPDTEPGRSPDEVLATVTVPGPFFLAATETTQGEFLAVMGRSPARWPPKMRAGGSCPVDSVTADEAAEFCRKLTARDADRRPGWAYRLPTEAEWELAARAGTATPFVAGTRLRFGTDAFYNPDAPDPFGLGEPGPGEKGLPHPVGQTRPNGSGLCDTAGNVWEQTLDGGRPVARGGSWREPAARCRSAARRVLDADERADDVGFRVAFAPTR